MAINDIMLTIIKQYVKQNRFQMMFDKKADKLNDKTYKFMVEKGLTEELFVKTVIENLKPSDYCERRRDNIKFHDDGEIFIFKTNQLDARLYVKVKILDDLSLLLVLSIHPQGMYN